MFRKIILHNFKSFSDLEFNLEGRNGIPLKTAMVFGENGAGKTNLIDSVRFLKESVSTYDSINQKAISMLLEALEVESGDSEDFKEIKSSLNGLFDTIRKLPDDKQDLGSLIRNYMTVGSEDGMRVTYVFDVDGNRTEYTIGSDREGRLVYENLRSVKESRIGNYYSIESDGERISARISDSLITDPGFMKETREAVRRYWGRHSLFSMLNHQFGAKNEIFMRNAVSAGFRRIRDYVDSVMIGTEAMTTVPELPFGIVSGIIGPGDSKALDAYETAIDAFFTSICSDIRRVYYHKEDRSGRMTYSLMFDRMIAGKTRSIPYEQESSGTRKLVRLFPSLIGCLGGRTVFIDELDSNIHDRMIMELIQRIIGSVSGQLVFTTHNTQLLEGADPRTAFIIDVDPDGFKSISPISRIARTQSNHNNRIRYLNGTFSGVPYVGYIDLEGIVGTLSEELREVR